MRELPDRKIFATSVILYLGALAWAFFQGPGSFLAGMLSGCGSILMGVWLGLTVDHKRRYTGGEHEDTGPD